MPIFKLKTLVNYAAVPNAAMRDKRLSIEAKGTLCYLLTHSDAFDFKFEFLQQELNIGRDKLKKIVRELKINGYLSICAAHDKNGNFAGQEWFIFAESQSENFLENPYHRPTENPSVGNHRPTEITSDGFHVRRFSRPTENPSDNIRKKKSFKKEKEELKEKELNNNVETTFLSDSCNFCNSEKAANENGYRAKKAAAEPEAATPNIEIPETDKPVNKKPEADKPKPDKPKPEEEPELVFFRRTLTTYQNDYAAPTTKGAAIAQAIAIRRLFELARGQPDKCIEIHESLQIETWRGGRVDWTTVLKNFNFYGKKRQNNDTYQPNSQRKPPTNQEILERSAEYFANLAA